MIDVDEELALDAEAENEAAYERYLDEQARLCETLGHPTAGLWCPRCGETLGVDPGEELEPVIASGGRGPDDAARGRPCVSPLDVGAPR